MQHGKVGKVGESGRRNSTLAFG